MIDLMKRVRLVLRWARLRWASGSSRSLTAGRVPALASVPLLALLVASMSAGAADSVTLEWTTDTFQVPERDGPMEPVVRLSSPISDDVQITWSVTDVTATYGEDYSVWGWTMFIPKGQNARPTIV